ncbi:MAG: OsmC family protein [Bacteroidota bacterium]
MTAARLKDLYERKRRALARRPSFGRTYAQAHVHLGQTLLCEVEEESHRTRVDQSLDEGGTGSAPHPGQMMRASIAACLAMGYRLWGARLDVAIAGVAVDVLCEFDARGQLGIEGVAVGWQRIVIDVRIASDAPEADIQRVVETADRLNPLLANLSPAIQRVHHLRVVHPV